MTGPAHLGVLIAYSCVAFSLAGMSAVGARVLKHQSRYRPQAKAANLVQMMDVGTYVFLWFGISVTFTLLNKWFLTYWRGGFSFPITGTTGHIAMKALLARGLVDGRCGKYFERTVEPVPLPLTLQVIFPIGFMTATDVMLSNVSFKFVTVTFYTIVKSSTLVWILLWAVLFRIEKPNWAIAITVTVISLGLGCASYGETNFSMVGLLILIGASASGGLRWALIQRLMALEEMFEDPLIALYHIAPWSFITMLIMAVSIEGTHIFAKENLAQFQSQATLEALVLTFIGGIMAFVLIVAEVKLVQLTSSLTLGVFGTCKELIQIMLAIIVFKDTLTVTNTIGLILAVGGTSAYHRIKDMTDQDKPSNEEYNPVSQADLELEALGTNGLVMDEDDELSDGWDDTGVELDDIDAELTASSPMTAFTP
uniref:Sugar phosphate transporter domain-containing protein n=1 Tax=Florenciella parvula TaxID=236787 RepID=A0A7S2FM58_9STRA|mmetsp:Transcript_17740/g.37146  ORF Transcript_17740/g.37146 Transcript_17740/m.37146 type:complete len:424 (+) Transcript_17740:27-1298(+)